jgi:hypothetical protein
VVNFIRFAWSIWSGLPGQFHPDFTISNHRIKAIDGNTVTFTYKNYKSGAVKKQMTLTHEEFIRRFALHILPKHFVKIRHCGILSSTWKRQKLKALQEKMQIRLPELKAIEQPERICSCCKVGKLHHHSILRQTWPTANRYRHGPKESESIGQPPKILSGGVGDLCSKVSKNGTLAR